MLSLMNRKQHLKIKNPRTTELYTIPKEERRRIEDIAVSTKPGWNTVFTKEFDQYVWVLCFKGALKVEPILLDVFSSKEAALRAKKEKTRELDSDIVKRFGNLYHIKKQRVRDV